MLEFTNVRLLAEKEATEALLEMLVLAERVRLNYEYADMALPPCLVRLYDCR